MIDRAMKAAEGKYAGSAMGRMGLTPSLTTHVAQSTPTAVIPTVHATAAPNVPAAKMPASAPAASNAQRDQMIRTMQKTNRVQQTYGVPGAK